MTVEEGVRPARGRPAAVELLERDAELAAIDRALDAARSGHGLVVLVEGEAGIGKSALLEHAAAVADGKGFRVLSARGGELEREYVNGVVVDLLGPTLREPAERKRRLSGLAAAASPVFGIAAEMAGDGIETVHGLYWLTVDLATSAPLMLAVDDGHWVDEGSLRYLSYLGRRVAELPVAIVVALRPSETDEPAALRELRASDHALRIAPERLTLAGVGALLHNNGMAADEQQVAAFWAATRGNPLYVHEVTRHPEAASALAAGEDAPEPLARAVAHRIGLLAPEARRVAEAVAVLGEAATIDRVSRLTQIDHEATHATVRRLIEASVLEAADTVTFSHPVVRTATYAAIPPVTRAGAHRRAAMLLADDEAPSDAIAAQLLLAEATGDPRVVELLRDGARRARAQAEPAAAARYLERALREPPATGDRPIVVAELASAEAAHGAPTATERYREALRLATSDTARAALELELGHTLVAAADWEAAAAAFKRGMALAGDRDAVLAARLEAGYVASAWVSMTRDSDADAILVRAQQADAPTPEQRELLMARAFQQVSAAIGKADDHAKAALRLMGDVPIEEMVRSGQLVELTTGVLLTTDALDAEVDLLTRAIDAVPRTGRFAKLGVYSYCRSWPHYFMGNLVDAAADAEAAVHAHEHGWETFFPVASGVLAYARLERGEVEAARQAIEAVDQIRFAGRIDTEVFVPIARGRILLASGDARGAAEQFLAAGAAAERVNMRILAPADWRPWAAIALARAGDRRQAHEVAAEGLELARAWGARWTLAVSLRTMGAVTRGPEGIELLEEAVALARSTPARLEECRSLVKLGEAHRRRGELIDARRVLSEAIDLGHRIGARAIEARARSELRTAGGRPRRFAVRGRDALTPAEARVAELVAAGRTNRQAAEALFVTPKAVEFHLANAYRKLGISSRSDLAGALRDEEAASV